MITCNGYDDVIRRVYEHGQEHVFAFWNELNESEQQELCRDLSGIDFELLEKIYASRNESVKEDYRPAPWIGIPESEEERSRYEEARAAGIEHVRGGRVAAFVVAGGQGSRLGFDGPKGKFPVTPVTGKTLFRVHAEKILKYSEKYGVDIPWFIMTSQANHDDTLRYFEEENWFGFSRDDIFLFPQNMIPSLDTEGRLILESKNRIFANPDGHGGSLTALRTSGSLDVMKERGIDLISYFQVDNPLVRIIDPAFIGFHTLRGADISSKALKKTGPGEKVGVFVEFSGGRTGVVEYSDLPEDRAGLRDENGELQYRAGSIAIHLFSREFCEAITSGADLSLPFHTARKKITAFVQGRVREIEGYKFEKFVFDALLLTGKNVVFETDREGEFAPVKNAEGVDSVESARQMMTDLYRSWLTEQGIRVPDRTSVIEISPLLAVEPGDIDRSLSLPDEERIYLG